MPLAHAEDMARAVGRHGHGDAMDAVLRGLETPWAAVRMEMESGCLTIRDARAVQALPHVVEALRGGCTAAVLVDLDEPCLLPVYLHGTGLGALSERGLWRVAHGAPSAAQTDVHPVTADQIARLEVYAARTYVPASATSRDGAGQGADQD